MDAADVAYRSATLGAVVEAAHEDLTGVWLPVSAGDPERAASTMRAVVPEVAASYGDLAGGNAASWFEDVRPSGPAFRPRPFVPASLAETVGLTTWAVTPLFSGDVAGAWERLAGLLQKVVTDHDRVTIEENSALDPLRPSWSRRASADACTFCAYMAVAVTALNDRLDERAAADKYHDHCRCVPVLEWPGFPAPEQPNGDAWAETFEAAWQAVNADQEAAYRQWSGRRHDFLRKHQHLTLTSKNIIARARRLSPDLFRDGVRLTA